MAQLDRFTHIGIVLGCSRAIPRGYAAKVSLREAETVWIDQFERHWCKTSGRRMPLVGYSNVELDVLSVEEAPDEG